LNKSVLFRSEYLDEPDRWFVDLINTTLSPSMEYTDTIIQPNAIAVSSLRIGRHPDQTTRVAVDLKERDTCHSYALYDPFRVVLDCVKTDQLKQIDLLESNDSSFVESLNHIKRDIQISSTLVDKLSPSLHKTPDLLRDDEPLLTPRARAIPEPNLDGSYSIARQSDLGISRIVIDAGHGGHDPGAVGGGMTEADLVLDLALRLEDRFLTNRPDLEIVQTRRTDRYLPLEARTTLANRVAADLFLSIHVNASENKAARGIETYYLDFTSDNNSADLTVHENIDGLSRINHVDSLVSTIALQTKLDESKELANTIQHAMVRKLRAVDPELPNLGVKRAPFVVLIGANMPSVLAEVSFLSNEHDATMLSTDAYRDLIVDALFTSILRYERSLAPAMLVAQGEAARLQ
jgi:N-acetylmuramoyl-L-alanine amidase